MKIVNKSKWTYFLVAIFGISVFFGMLFFAPQTVIAPFDSDIAIFTPEPDVFGRPEPSGDEPQTTPSPSKEGVRLVFTGDIMMARAVEWTIKEKGAAYPFAKLGTELFAGADAVIGNFEGTIRETEHIEQTNVMAFDTLPVYVSALKDAGFTSLSIANNHADDFGSEVTEFTRDILFEEGLLPFGDPLASQNEVHMMSNDGAPVSFIGFHAFGEDPASIVNAIKYEKELGSFVIIYPHWGVEYDHEPSVSQREAAEAWIDAGADLIIGAHPHVVQSVEIIDGVPVVYSLGNFLFDQDFSQDTKTGAVATVELDKQRNIAITFAPIRIQGRQMYVDRDYDDELAKWLGLESLTLSVDRTP